VQAIVGHQAGEYQLDEGPSEGQGLVARSALVEFQLCLQVGKEGGTLRLQEGEDLARRRRESAVGRRPVGLAGDLGQKQAPLTPEEEADPGAARVDPA
jgi:hypothetical protein